MTAESKPARNTPVVGPNVPPLEVVDENPKAGPGEVVVISPTGFRSVVPEDAVDSLKPQGYKVG